MGNFTSHTSFTLSLRVFNPKIHVPFPLRTGGTAFASEWSPFSNLFRTDIYYKGIWFNSAEQCYQFRRANAEGHEDTAESILLLTDPYECKKTGDQHKETEEWQKECDKEMTKIVAAKFNQNENIMQMLMESEGPLFEATTDDYWGTGFSLCSKETKKGRGTGTNKLGSILVALRDGPPGSDDSQSSVDTSSVHGSCNQSERSLPTHSATEADL